MEKSSTKINKIIDQIASQQIHGAQKAIKKLREKPEKGMTAADDAVLGMLSAYCKMQSFKFGTARKEFAPLAKLMEAPCIDVLMDRSNFIQHLLECLEDTRLIADIFSKQMTFADPVKQGIIRKPLVNLLAMNENFAECSALLGKMAVGDEKSWAYQFASMACKLFQILTSAKKQVQAKDEPIRHQPFKYLDLSIPSNDLKLFQITLKLMSSLKDKYADLNTPSFNNFILYMKICSAVNADDTEQLLATLNKFPVDYEFFGLLKKLIKMFEGKSEIKEKVQKVFNDAFFDYIFVVDVSQLASKMPDFETLAGVINSLEFSNSDLSEPSALLACGTPSTKDKISAILNLPMRVLTTLVNNQLILGQSSEHSFHRKNWLLAILIASSKFSADSDQLRSLVEWAAREYILRFSDNYLFANEVKHLFEVKKQTFDRISQIFDQLADKLNPAFVALNKFKLAISIGWNDEQTLVSNLQFCIGKYHDQFDSKKVLEKGERRQEDEWLVLALEISQRLFELTATQSYLHLTNHLASFGFEKSKYNFDILLSLVRSNRLLGVYVHNSELFYENDLKGNQHETLGYLFHGTMFEFRVGDKNVSERLERIFKNYQEVCSTSQKNFANALKASNFVYQEEFAENWEMTQGSYFKAILYEYISNGFLLKALKKGTEADEAAENFSYFSKILGDLSKFRYLNLDLMGQELYGAYINPAFTNSLLDFNRICFDIAYADLKPASQQEALARLSGFLEQCRSADCGTFFKVMRRNVTDDDINIVLTKETDKYKRLITQKEVHSFFETFESIVQLIDRISRGESITEQISQLKNKTASISDKTELGAFVSFFSTGMTIDLLSKSSYLFDKLSIGNKELTAAKIGELMRTKVNGLIDGLTPVFASTDKFAELLGGEKIAEFLQVKDTAKLVAQKAHDSVANFKFSMEQNYKVR
jgi:hypothetical protein